MTDWGWGIRRARNPVSKDNGVFSLAEKFLPLRYFTHGMPLHLCLGHTDDHHQHSWDHHQQCQQPRTFLLVRYFIFAFVIQMIIISTRESGIEWPSSAVSATRNLRVRFSSLPSPLLSLSHHIVLSDRRVHSCSSNISKAGHYCFTEVYIGYPARTSGCTGRGLEPTARCPAR